MVNDRDTASIKVRARAVDLLGRQQIAGIPTALHELFKNAYDAFARRVEVDLLVQRRTLILRDDGFGMTENDFRNRWLTLGTESKVGQGDQTAEWLGNYGKIPRKTLGEKGIGRLAIASIGPAVLVLTRASRPDGLHDLVASLIHWGVFEIPGLNLDRIRIPVRTFPGGTLPDRAGMERMIERLMAGINDLRGEIPNHDIERIEADIRLMRFSPDEVLSGLDAKLLVDSDHLSLAGDGHGTHFIIRPYDTVLDADLTENTTEKPSRLEKYLIGFGNTMLPDLEPPPIKAAFREHRNDGEIRDHIGEKEFFTPNEYLTADHIIEGQFDNFGQFTGTVKIYDRQPMPYTLSWTGSAGTPIQCGPFSIRFGHIQGWPHQSLLSAEDWARMDTKLARLGGLYIYRDGVRILPYGDSDFDFLYMERRRSLAVKDWFFTFRRMLGAVILSSEQNSSLQEKAGREGFRENAAYRQFRDILENLLKSLAKDFFRESASLGDYYIKIRDEMDSRDKLLRKREKQVKAKKEKFKDALDDFFTHVELGTPGKRIEDLCRSYDSRFDAVAELDDPDIMGSELHNLENDLRGALDSLRKSFKVSRPQGIGLTKGMTADWQAYKRVAQELEVARFKPLADHFDSRLSDLLKQRGDAVNRRLLLRNAIEARQQDIRRTISREVKDAREELSKTRDTIASGISDSVQRLQNHIQDVLSDFERTEVAERSTGELIELRNRFESRLEAAALEASNFLNSLRDQLEALSDGVEQGILPDDVTSALEDRTHLVQEELEESLQWAQVGMALGIVQHEFNGVVRKIKKDIGSLQPWAAGTPQLRELFTDLRNGFSHLEEYLRLFAPLDRRMRRVRVELSGEEIRQYILNIFSDRFVRHGIRLDATDAFNHFVAKVFPSTLLPVFINLVDNACYWLSKVEPERRWIRINLHRDGIIVENGGAGIESRLAERIFEFGFSTKPDGRGMGLSIARRSLRHEGMDIRILNPGIGNPPCFLILLGPDDETESAL